MMIDTEIIKAYECCTLNACDCISGCPYRGTGGKLAGEECLRKVRKDVLNLLNQQEEKIGKPYKENFELKDGYFQKRYEETEHQELMGLREALIRVDRERDYFQLKAISLEEENKQLIQELIEHDCRRKNQ